MIVSSCCLAVVLALSVAPNPDPAPPPAQPTEVAPPSSPPSQPSPPPPTAAPDGPPSSFPPPSAPPPSAAPPPSTTAPTAQPPAPAPTATPEVPVAPPPTPDPTPDPASTDPPPTDPVPAPVAVQPAPVEPVPAPTLPPPAPTTGIDAAPAADIPAPTRNGRGMLIAAGVLGTVGGIIKVATTVSAIQQMDGGLPMSTIIGGAVFYDPFIASAIGLAGGGMARRGRLDAHNELFEGGTPRRKAKRGLGWGLFGGGVGLWTVTRIAGLVGCPSQACVARVWETGYYLSLAGTVPGVVIGGYATGYHAYHRRFGALASRVTLAPIAHRGAWGLSLGGRF